MIADETRVDFVALDNVEIEGFEQAFSRGAQGEIGFNIDHVPLHVAAFDHGFEFAVVGWAILYDSDAAGLAERISPGLFLRLLGASAPTDKIHALGGHRGLAGNAEQSRKKDRGCSFVQHHFHALIVVFLSGLALLPACREQ